MANKLPSINLERLLTRIKSPLTRYSAKYIAQLLSQIGKNGNLQTSITLRKMTTGEIFFKFKLTKTIPFE